MNVSLVGIFSNDINGLTPLHFAADRGLESIVLYLIELGSNIEALDNVSLLESKKSLENLLSDPNIKNNIRKMCGNHVIDEKINGWCYTPLDKVKQRLNSTGYPQNNLHYVVGDVMETLKDKKTIPEKIAILRLDTDWYESSKYELEQMYDNVVTGGIIIFDDYYHWDGQRRATDEFFLSRNINYNFVNLGNHKTSAIIKK
jgi:hypothetical protein